MVAQRAGGISDARKVDVRACCKKNQDSGDALMYQKNLDGTIIVDWLGESTPDSLGDLETSQCCFCGALKCFLISKYISLMFTNWICTFGSGGEWDQPFIMPWWPSQPAERPLASS